MTTKKDTATADEGNDEVQAKVDDALAKGYIGSVPDPEPNSAHSLASGPDSPLLAPDDRTRTPQHAAPKEG